MSFLYKCLSHRIIRASLAVTMTSLMLLLAGCAAPPISRPIPLQAMLPDRLMSLPNLKQLT